MSMVVDDGVDQSVEKTSINLSLHCYHCCSSLCCVCHSLPLLHLLCCLFSVPHSLPSGIKVMIRSVFLYLDRTYASVNSLVPSIWYVWFEGLRCLMHSFGVPQGHGPEPVWFSGGPKEQGPGQDHRRSYSHDPEGEVSH